LRGGDFIILDDPIKPDDALSESVRKSANDWFDNTLLSRLNDKAEGCIIIVTQRLHQDDLVGHVLAVEHLHELHEVHERAAQPIDLVDDHDVHSVCLDVLEQSLQGGAFKSPSGRHRAEVPFSALCCDFCGDLLEKRPPTSAIFGRKVIVSIP
jgi:hypothetical protein